ncbi:arylesterase [Thalassotalea castellviae]|uniref:Arylesterase n=1 Tax=Thalassotalea castellviae TaxID=3075612 RepID=A0ABU3A5U1_9GAMM|nr:arylesterase [Thalassotalea sp. W431]MDT0605253.1 arylesterase [Thalassotalea sp. W431]
MKKYSSIALFLFGYLTLMTTSWATSSILLLGDSVSAGYGMEEKQGWVHLLNERLMAKKLPYKIINASVSGETTAGGLSRLEGVLKENKVDHLIIELGGNDGLRGYPPKSIKKNLLQMINIAKQKAIPVSLMKIKITPNYGTRYLKMFEAVFDEVAEETNSTLLPFFMEQVALDSDLMQQDGIHPNIKAQPIIATYVEKQLTHLME